MPREAAIVPSAPRSTPRQPLRPLHGVVLIDKPVGPGSTAVLARARRLWRAQKAGHTGTLDPLASGVLPICFGAATKFAQVALDADKRYLATLHLGITREGGDLEGRVLSERAVHIDRAAIDAVIARFIGAIDQVPPMQSAIKRDGQPLYKLARAGVEVERKARSITVHGIDVTAFDAPSLTLDVRCSKGTYIRTLAEDIGQALGCGAHLAALRRTATGSFTIDDAISLDAAERLDEGARDARLEPVDALLAPWPRIDLDADNAARFLTGLRRRVEHADAAQLRVYGPDPEGPGTLFLGSAHVSRGELISDRLLSPLEIQSQARLQSPSRVQPRSQSPSQSQPSSQVQTKTRSPSESLSQSNNQCQPVDAAE